LYNKAEKFDRLVTYLISQSQTCVKQHGDYEKAMQYLKEASAISVKLNASATKEIKKLISERVSTMEWFVYAQESFHTMDRLSLENLCLDLLSPQSNQIIREADCYALLVNYFFASDQHQTAYTYLQKMQECGNDPCEFLEKSMVKTILQSVGNKDSLSDDG
jgi:RNase P subunit RPR2